MLSPPARVKEFLKSVQRAGLRIRDFESWFCASKGLLSPAATVTGEYGGHWATATRA